MVMCFLTKLPAYNLLLELKNEKFNKIFKKNLTLDKIIRENNIKILDTTYIIAN